MHNLFLTLTGCVKIEISGSGIEKLLNNAAKQKIHIKDLRMVDLKLTGNVSPKDFLRLKNARKGIDAKIKIIKKSGLVFKTRPHRKRVGFIAGMLVFFAILKLLSMFIWGVEVSGNKAVKKSEILSVCEALGIKNGVLQSSVDPKLSAEKLLLRIDKLTWAAINIEGCYVTVNVSEAQRDEGVMQKPPSNIVAKYDGIITKIDTISGNTLVSVGDAVAKGDILVSGVMEAKGVRAFVKSGGEIYAETTKTYTKSEKYKCDVFVKSGLKKRRVITFLWLKIPLYLGKTKSPYKIKTTKTNLAFSGKKMPAGITTADITLLKKKRVNYSTEKLEALLKKRVEEDIKKSEKGDYRIISTKFTETPDGLSITETVKTNENIAIEVPIRIE